MRCPAKACQGNNVQAEALRYAQAEALYRQCWEVRKKTLGEDHPETLISLNRSLNNMANALSSQGNNVQAEALRLCPSQQCWEVHRGTARRRHWGKITQKHCHAEHPQQCCMRLNSISLNNMAVALSRQGNYVQA
uniref:Kinesin light chain n=1 Tax=Ditylum brightwellii TaxID=49249 RepID=A0A7S4VHD6_9STRA